MTLAVKGKIGLSGWPSGERLLLFSEVGSQSRAEGLLLQMCWILLAPLVHEVTPLFSCSPQIRKWPLDKSTTRLLGYLIRRWLFIFGSPKVLLLTIGQRQHCLSDALFCMSKCHWDRNASIISSFQFSPRSRPTILCLWSFLVNASGIYSTCFLLSLVKR